MDNNSVQEQVRGLYQQLFDVEDRGDEIMARQIRLDIESLISGAKPSTVEPIEDLPIGDFIMEDFMIEAKRRPFYSAFQKLWNGVMITELHLAKALSSYVTHGIIEIERQQGAYQHLKIGEASGILSAYLQGEISYMVVEEYVKNDLGFLNPLCAHIEK